MWRSRMWLLVVLLMPLLSLGAFAPTASAQSGPTTFSGVLTDGSGNPVSGAGVDLFYPGSTRSAAGTTTASDGSFSMQVAPGNYGLGVTSENNFGGPGFTAEDLNGDINLNNGSAALDLQFPALASVDVTVDDATGSPVSGAGVHEEADVNGGYPYGNLPLWSEGPSFSVSYNPLSQGSCSTDSTGQCSVETFIGAAGLVSASVPNGPSITSSLGPVASDPTSVALQLPPTNTFSGVLTDGSGNPVSGAGVDLFYPGSTRSAAGTTTASDGSFSMQVAPGNYGLGVTSENNFGGPGFTAEDLNGDINLNNGSAALDLQFPALASVDVTVDDATGSRVSGAGVHEEADVNGGYPYGNLPLWSEGPSFSVSYNPLSQGSCSTDSTGQCSVETFIGAAGLVSASVPNGPSITSSLGPVASDPTSVALQLPPTNTFSGVLTDGSGNPVSGAGVDLFYPGSTRSAAGTTTASDGSFSMQVAPGNYGLGVTSENNFGGPGFTAEDLNGDINLNNGSAALDLQFPALASVDVTVDDATGSPVSGAGVHEEADVNGGYPYGNLPLWSEGPSFSVSYNPLSQGSCSTDSTGQCSVETFIGAAGLVSASVPNGPSITSSLGPVASDPTSVALQLSYYAQVPSEGVTSGVVGISSPDGTQLEGVSATSIPAGSLPPGFNDTSGDLGFEVAGLSPGQSIVVTVQLPAGSNPTNILKLVDGSYVDASSIATINGNTVSLQLTDGGFGDEDGMANGTIVDPLVPVRENSTSPPSVTIQPTDQTVPAGGAASFTAGAIGSPAPDVQWKVSANGGGTYTPIAGATSSTYSFTTTGSQSGDLFEAVFSNGVGSAATSNSCEAHADRFLHNVDDGAGCPWPLLSRTAQDQWWIDTVRVEGADLASQGTDAEFFRAGVRDAQQEDRCRILLI